MTRIVKVGLHEIEHPALHEAADIMRQGGLVVFPTETVYGLGTIAYNESAVLSVFNAKNRDKNSPLPIQISDISMLPWLSSEPLEHTDIIARKFWPGPLTIVLPKNNRIPDSVTAGQKTVAVRIPDHPIALQILRLLNAPAVATSANISGCPPPTSAAEALQQIGDKVDFIIDSGPCFIGTSSTIISISGCDIKILRQGTITLDDIKQALT